MVPRLLNLLTEPTVTHPDLKVAVAYALGKTAITKVQKLLEFIGEIIQIKSRNYFF